jgi:hypothetical protein
MSFMERVAPVVDETIRALAKTKFIPDPVAGLKYSRATIQDCLLLRRSFNSAAMVFGARRVR